MNAWHAQAAPGAQALSSLSSLSTGRNSGWAEHRMALTELTGL